MYSILAYLYPMYSLILGSRITLVSPQEFLSCGVFDIAAGLVPMPIVQTKTRRKSKVAITMVNKS